MEFQVEIIRRDSLLVGMGLKRRQYTQPFLSMQVVFTAGRMGGIAATMASGTTALSQDRGTIGKHNDLPLMTEFQGLVMITPLKDHHGRVLHVEGHDFQQTGTLLPFHQLTPRPPLITPSVRGPSMRTCVVCYLTVDFLPLMKCGYKCNFTFFTKKHFICRRQARPENADSKLRDATPEFGAL